jgi:hypothetical protein
MEANSGQLSAFSLQKLSLSPFVNSGTFGPNPSTFASQYLRLSQKQHTHPVISGRLSFSGRMPR